MSTDIARLFARPLTDEELVEDLDPVLAAHVLERLEDHASRRQLLEICWCGRVFGWEAED